MQALPLLQLVEETRSALEAQLQLAEAKIRKARVTILSQHEIVPSSTQSSRKYSEDPVSCVDYKTVQHLSAYIAKHGASISDTIRAWRGQTEEDNRPNKALDVTHLPWLLHGYDQVAILIDIASSGVRHRFRNSIVPPQPIYKNHASAQMLESALLRSIGEGQQNGTYLVVNASTATTWTDLHFSPFRCVPKPGADTADEARVIHDLSHPRGNSTNDWSDQNCIPPLTYAHVDAIARRILELRMMYPGVRIFMMTGDVKSAFRIIPVHESVSPYFAGKIHQHDLTVLDLSLPFGWTGSPAYYGVFGAAVSFLVRRESPASMNPTSEDAVKFFCYDWVDDHVLIEPSTQGRLSACEAALRLAMMAVLGPRAMNEKKFTKWDTKLTALGLEWDTEAATVSMPERKIRKALSRIQEMRLSSSTTRSALEKLLGSLRHICMCIRPAKPFFQRLARLWRKSPRFGSVALSKEARLDLHWFEAIVLHGRLCSVPLTLFKDLPTPAVHIYMDASNEGLCVLHPARREFLRIRFDTQEKALIENGSLSINVREQLSATFAALVWDAQWTCHDRSEVTHVRAWIDNKAAVTWCNKRYSNNEFSQEMNRVIGATEAMYGIRLSAEHLPGHRNGFADLGSRAWTDINLLSKWRELTSTWTQVFVPAHFRKIYTGVSSPFKSDPSQILHFDSILAREINGVRSVRLSNAQDGFREIPPINSLFSWLCLQSTRGQPMDAKQQEQSKQNSVTLSGFTEYSPDLLPNSTTVTVQRWPECVDSVYQHNQKSPLHLECSSELPSESQSVAPSTASFFGLRCWASTFY